MYSVPRIENFGAPLEPMPLRARAGGCALPSAAGFLLPETQGGMATDEANAAIIDAIATLVDSEGT